MIGAFIGGFAEISNLSLIPNVALAAGRSQEAALGILSVMTVGGIALQFPLGWLADKISRFVRDGRARRGLHRVWRFACRWL